MHRLACYIVVLVALASPLAAQFQLSTLFASNNGNAPGGANYFDLDLDAGIGITQLDINCPASALGTAGTLDVFVTAVGGTAFGNEQSPAGWTPVVTGAPFMARAQDTPTPVMFQSPIVLAPGRYGVAVCASTGLRYLNSWSTFSDAVLTLTAGTAQNVCLAPGSVFNPRLWNGTIHYGIRPGFARATPYGTGCIDGAASFYEYLAGTPFDLAGTPGQEVVIRMTPQAAGYRVERTVPAFFAPVSADLGLGDEQIAERPLPFAFAYPGGVTTRLWISSNGFAYLAADPVPDRSPSSTGLLRRAPRLCPAWLDLDPSAGGSVHFDVDPNGRAVYVTWLAVAEHGVPGTANTLQCAVDQDGVVEFRYRAVRPFGSALVGWSPGRFARDPGNLHISVALPFATEPDEEPLALWSERPVIGGTSALVTWQVPGGTTAGAQLLGFARFDPGIDLTGIGMAGCFLLTDPVGTTPITATGGTARLRLLIPNDPSLAGGHLFAQTVTLTPGSTALGLITSNGVDLLLDLN